MNSHRLWIRFWLGMWAWLLFVYVAMGATVRWVGNAQDVHGVWTIAVTGTWATGDKAVLVINNKSLIVTVGSSFSAANVADILARAGDAASATENLLGNETRNFGGEELPEFAELDFSASGTTLTITTESPGVSLTAASGSLALTRSETTAGDGALGAITEVTAATGKNWFNQAANWEGGALPAATDTLVFDSGSVDVLYGLSNATLDYQIRRTNGYSGNIGLPKQNANGYVEYRKRFLALPVTVTTGTATHYIGGESNATAAGRTYLDFGTTSPSTQVVIVRDAPVIGSDGHAVQLVGGTKIELSVYRGSVGVGTNVGQNASVVRTLFVNYTSNKATDANVRVGQNASFQNIPDTIKQTGGVLALDCEVNDAVQEVAVYDGLALFEITSGVNDLMVYGGRVDFRGQNVVTLYVYAGGEFDLSANPGMNFSNPIELFRGFIFKDPLFRTTGTGAEYRFNGCTPADGTLILRNNLALVPSEIP